MKKTACTLFTYICLLAQLSAFETPYIKGHAGLMSRGAAARSDPISDSEEPTFSVDASAQGYFGAEVDISDKLILRSDFLVDSAFLLDISKDGVGKEFLKDKGTVPATFQVEELSATYAFHTKSVIHYLSAFLGEFEPVGMDTFLERQFGILPISSALTRTWSGQSGANINDFYGAGVSYMLRFEQPVAVGFYLYQDFDRLNATNPQNNFNTDLRFAFAFPYVTLDWDIGLGFPHGSTKGTFETEVLIVRYVTLRTGLNMLIGNPSDPVSLLVQGGFSEVEAGFDAYENHNFVEDLVQNLYFLVEPRVKIRDVDLTLTFFNRPSTQTIPMIYNFEQKGGMGADLGVSTDHFHLGNLNFTIGMHATVSDQSTLYDIVYGSGSFFGDPHFTLTPYVTIPLFGGSITSAVSVDITKLIDDSSFWVKSLSFWLGFRAEF